ncbi:MAG: hypothetical protein GOMPHAMPRED_000279 [Gomphillus americanus]|uniref:Uncharacterized protein n=1 Tax=Gomphillus americanus TaxID=1940652 RepID=A0A8H3EF17_9LECA|nr:MAG: hypothetical protein GOMPHAMPRED_000279 [Gomphillus americanus]
MSITSAATLPLTTIFTAPTSCFETITFGYPDGALRVAYDPACIPSGEQTLERTYAFSPALNCPSDYETVRDTTTVIGQATETRAICCPVLDSISGLSGYQFQYNYNTDNRPWYTTLGCTLELTKTMYLDVLDNGTIVHAIFTTGGVNAYSVQIAWQSSDLSTSSSTTLTSSTTPSATSSTTSPGALATSSTPAVPTTSDVGLSTGAKVAIGVVVPLTVIGLIIAIFLFRRYRQRRQPRELKHVDAYQQFSQDTSGVPLGELADRTKYPSQNQTQVSHVELPGEQQALFPRQQVNELPGGE